jgi:hypothetical protein
VRVVIFTRKDTSSFGGSNPIHRGGQSMYGLAVLLLPFLCDFGFSAAHPTLSCMDCMPPFTDDWPLVFAVRSCDGTLLAYAPAREPSSPSWEIDLRVPASWGRSEAAKKYQFTN